MRDTMFPMIVVDTETTDFKPGHIAQLAYLRVDGGEVTGAGNHYFAVETMSPGAEEVHGLSVERLRLLSGGVDFAGRADEFLGDFEGRTLTAHNVSFDLGFLAAEFGRIGRVYSPPSTFCTMRMSTVACRIPHPLRGGYKWPTLEEAVRCLGIAEDEVNALVRRFFGGEDRPGFHDARFDAAAVYLIWRRLRR